MIRFLFISVALAVTCKGAFYERFPGFKELFGRAEFVGIVTLNKRAVPRNDRERLSDSYGPHRFFEIESVIVFKGKPIQSQVARLADYRLHHDGDQYFGAPYEDILTPEKQFLVFLQTPVGPSDRYTWDCLNAEGAVLPISPKTNLHTMEVSKPFVVFDQVISDYKDYCKALYEHAIQQERILNKQGQQGAAGQPATRSESKPEGDQKPQPKSEGRSR